MSETETTGKDPCSIGTPAVVESIGNEKETRPVCAKYEPPVFWLLRKRGKSLCNGGFGIVLPKVWTGTTTATTTRTTSSAIPQNNVSESNGADFEEDEQFNINEQQAGKHDSSDNCVVAETMSENATTTTEEYLQIEEVLYLFERGVLEVLDQNDSPMKSHQLYDLLNEIGMPLQLYLAYAHLRQQSFRVVRHSPERRKVLLAMSEMEQTKRTKSKNPPDEVHDHPNTQLLSLEDHPDNDDHHPGTNRMSLRNALKQELREASARAAFKPWMEETSLFPPPVTLSWDVYPPDQNFSRAFPGLPVFSVLVTSFSHPTITFGQIASCILQNHPVPIKIATISDSGIVILFGVSEDGIPPIHRQLSIPTETKME